MSNNTICSDNSAVRKAASSQDISTRLAVALRLAEWGLKLFPVRENAKQAAIKSWEAKATDDPATLRRWFGNKGGRFANGNIGVACGPSGIVVIDSDVKRGIDGEANLMALVGGDPIRAAELAQDHTFTVQTPTGGFHRYFRYAGDAIHNSASGIAPGVDIRAAGGYVLAPGSVVDSKPYRFVDGCDGTIEDLPDWLAETLIAASTKTAPRKAAGVELDTDTAIASALAYLATAPASIEGNGGHDNAYKVVCRTRDVAPLSDGTMLDCLDLWSNWNARNQPPFDRDELVEIISHAYSYAQNEAGCDAIESHFDILPDLPNDNTVKVVDGLSYQRASDVKQAPIEWLWPGHFAIGKVGGFAGVQGDGKSQTVCYMAAAITRGGTWIDGGTAPKGKVLILAAEDDASDTTAPRLEAAGADLDACLLINAMVKTKGQTRTLNLGEDLARIETLLDREPGIVALVIDPISAYLGTKADAYRNTEIRALLAPLGELAARRRLAVIFVTHFNKGGKGTALSRVTDSNAFTALARTFWLTIKERNHDGKETGRILFLDAKRNIGKRSCGRAYTIESVTLPSGIETSRVAWGDEVRMTPDEALAEHRPRKLSPVTDAACNFLDDLLARGPVLTTEVRDAAEGAGHAWATVRRASEKLGVQANRKNGAWWWSLSEAEIDHDKPWPEAA